MSDAPSGKLKEQDLTNLDVTKLTPSSPEVISRQATINIGTIGHVAHGKSTIVKAVSGVQTVRFKNELERNITIKLGSTNDDSQQNTSSVMTVQSGSNKRKNVESNLYSSKINVPSEEIVSNIGAAILSLDKSLENTHNSSDISQVTIPKHQTPHLKLWKKKLLKTVDNSDKDQNNSKIFKDPNDFVVNKNLKISACNSSNTMSKADGNIGHLNSVSPIVAPTETTTNDIKSNTENLVSTDYVNVCDGISLLERSALDTAFVTIPPMSDLELDQNDIIYYKFITGDSRVKTFILGGGMIDLNDNHIYEPNEIDEILDDVIVYGIRFYLVKWKNWSRGFNTWERFNALMKCQRSIYNYGLKKKSVTDEIKPIDGFHLMLPRKIISRMFELFRGETGLNLPMISTDDMSAFLNSMDIGSKNVQKLREKTFILNLASIFLSSFRQKQLIRLKEWEIDINIMTDGYRIKVENNMDLEGPPDFFVYSPKYVPHRGVIIPDDPPIGCSCKRNCLNSNNCCNEMSGYSAVYDLNKCITVATGCPVFECNKKCKCSSTCNNRVVQLGSKVNVSIYKTSNCGWGIKTNQIIKKGQFIAEYIGEVITVEESERRLENNTSLMDYMWNLDFDDSQNYKYIVDGTHYANFTYFINHSCHSNLNMYAVWVNCLDRNLPRLALFANREILPGEQLTSDYFARCNPVNLKKSGIKCQCRVKYCKGYYF